MAMQINTNILSLTAQRNLSANESRLGSAIERLSTGLRINSAKDDAAGLAISERFSSQIRGQSVAQRNANDAISFAQTAEGALGVMGDVLQRMRELTVQSLNGLNTAGDRAAIQEEMVQLREEVERIAQDTTFNGKSILNGTTGALNFQIGAERGDVLSMTGVDARASTLSGTQKAVSSTNLPDGFDYSTLADDLSVNGTTVDLDGVTTRDEAISAINAAFDGTVQAKAADTTNVSLAYSGAATGEFDLNGTNIDLFDGVPAALSIDDAISAINAVSGTTGVVASKDGTNIVFTDADGGDIVIANETGSVFGGSADGTYEAGIELSSSTGTLTVTGADATTLGLDGTVSDQSLKISEVSVATVYDANSALVSLDSAIDEVTSLRAELGAMQNRFENVVEVISVHRENLEAARSRIVDADFAAETANLTRAQILQQAGLSSLAQANSAPQNVLSLLQ